MRLPDSARADLLEFVGATPVADAQLSQMIDVIAATMGGERRAAQLEAN